MAWTCLSRACHRVCVTTGRRLSTVEQIGKIPTINFEPQKAETLLQNLGLLHFGWQSKKANLTVVSGSRCYMFVGDACRLEQALIRWTMNALVNEYGFTPVVVPHLLFADIIESCGFDPHGVRSQVYSVKGDRRVCLAGTSEIPLAALNIGQTFDAEDLPKKYCSTSRCYRAEAKTTKEEAGLYRVHYFNKVEMFGVCGEHQSETLLRDFVAVQKSLFDRLGLCFRVVDMPEHELGVSAARKFDIESWMNGRQIWGEISSASNCTDYQSSRLNIKYRTLSLNEETNEIFCDKFVHTVNGTACAVPRMIISVCEHYQTSDGHIVLPEVLRPYMNGQTVIDTKQTVFLDVDEKYELI